MTTTTVETDMAVRAPAALRVLANRAEAVGGVANVVVGIELADIAAVIGLAEAFGLDEVPAKRFNTLRGQIELRFVDQDHDVPLWRWCTANYKLTDAEVAALGLVFPVDSGLQIDELPVSIETLRRVVASC